MTASQLVRPLIGPPHPCSALRYQQGNGVWLAEKALKAGTFDEARALHGPRSAAWCK